MPQQHQKEEDEALPGGGNAKDALNGISRTNKLTVSNGVSFISNITQDFVRRVTFDSRRCRRKE